MQIQYDTVKKQIQTYGLNESLNQFYDVWSVVSSLLYSRPLFLFRLLFNMFKWKNDL